MTSRPHPDDDLSDRSVTPGGAGPDQLHASAAQAGRSAWLWWGVLVVALVVALRIDWQQRTLHTADTSLDHHSHLIGHLVRFVDEELVSLVSPRQLQQAAQRTDEWWQGAAPATREAYRDDLQQLLEARVSRSFDAVRGQVDAVADWYYRIGTNYELLLEMAREFTGNGDVEEYLRSNVQRILFVDSDVEARLDRDLDAMLAFHEQRLERVADSLERYATRQVHDMAAVRGRLHMRERVPDDEVTISATPLDWSGVREAALREVAWQPVVSGLGSTVVAAGAGRLAMSATVRGAGGQAARQAGARAGSRAASASAGLTAAGTGAALCGPLAAVCAPLAGLAAFGTTWLASDLIVTSADEALNRDDFTATLREQINTLEAQTLEELRQRMAGAFDHSARQLAEQHRQALLQPVDAPRSTVIPREQLRRP